MFNFKGLLARLRAQPSPLAQAVRDLDRGEHTRALETLSGLLGDPALGAFERAVLENKRGVALVHLGRREEALAAFCAALEARPRFAPALANVGNLLLEDGDLEDAIVHYEAAILADDRYGIAHLNLAVAYKRCGRTADSVREMRRASRLEGRMRLPPSKNA